jgi:hypothetical protein
MGEALFLVFNVQVPFGCTSESEDPVRAISALRPLSFEDPK